MKKVKRHSLLLLFLIGLTARLALLFYDYSWDINNHIAWAKDLHNRGFAGFYETQSSEVYASIFPNYPPLSNFVFYIFYYLQSLIEKIAWEINLAIPQFPSKLIFFIQSRAFLAALMKLPAVFADLGIAYVCLLFFRKIKSENQLTEKLITSLILFNPAFLYLSSLWGQIDSVPIFFSLLSIYLLFFTEKYLAGGIFFLTGVLTKPTSLIYLPVYLIFFIKKFKTANFLKALLACLIIFYLSFVPFLDNLDNFFLPFAIFSEKIMAAQSLPFVTNGAFNFWVLITGFEGIKDTAPFLFGISYRMWGYIITGLFVTFVIIKLFRHSGDPDLVGRLKNRSLKQRLWTSYNPFRDQSDIYLSFFLVAFASYLLLTKMHERYSLLPLPFLLLAGLKNKNLLRWFIILSLISFLNLYHSWPVPKLGVITDFLYLPHFTYSVSLFNVLLFFNLLKKIVKNSNKSD